MRRGGDESDDNNKNDSSYDPLDDKIVRSESQNDKIDHVKAANLSMLFTGPMIPNDPRMAQAWSNSTFDPKLLNQSIKYMSMMKKNGQAPRMMFNPAMLPNNTPGLIPNHVPNIQMLQNKQQMGPMNPQMLQTTSLMNKPQLVPNTNLGPIDPMTNKGQSITSHNKSTLNSILVKNIAPKLNKMVPLATYFDQFGEVIAININTNKNTAVIKFSDPTNARKAYMSKNTVLNDSSIQLVYNPNYHHYNAKNNLNVEDKKKPENIPQKAEIGSNLKFESESVKKKRELAEKNKQLKIQQQQQLRTKNSENT